MKRRKIPLRKCTGCQEMKEKKQLIRIVRNESGEFSLDHAGKKSGRGAYICPEINCFEKARKHKGLERSFQCAVPAEIYENLRSELIKNECTEDNVKANAGTANS